MNYMEYIEEWQIANISFLFQFCCSLVFWGFVVRFTLLQHDHHYFWSGYLEPFIFLPKLDTIYFFLPCYHLMLSIFIKERKKNSYICSLLQIIYIHSVIPKYAVQKFIYFIVLIVFCLFLAEVVFRWKLVVLNLLSQILFTFSSYSR